MELEFEKPPSLSRCLQLNDEINGLVHRIDENDKQFNQRYKLPRALSLFCLFVSAAIFFVPFTYMLMMLFQWLYSPTINEIIAVLGIGIMTGGLLIKVELMKVLYELFEAQTLEDMVEKTNSSWIEQKRAKLRSIFRRGVRSWLQKKQQPLLHSLEDKLSECITLMKNKQHVEQIHQCFRQHVPALGTQEAIEHATMYRQFILAIRDENTVLALKTVSEYFTKNEMIITQPKRNTLEHYI